MEYNTQREKLKITDYGRNVCKLIEYAKTIKDRDKRNIVAKIIINVMSQVNPTAKDNENYEEKLWDHLMIMSNYELDVDCPYAISKEATVNFTPQPIKNQQGRIRYRHYGKFLENMVNKAKQLPDGEEKEYLTELIAHNMKLFYLTWNRDTVNDELIFEQFSELTNNELKLKEDFTFLQTKDYLSGVKAAPLVTPNSSPSKKKKNNAAKNNGKKNKRSQNKKKNGK